MKVLIAVAIVLNSIGLMWNPVKELKDITPSGAGVVTISTSVESGEGIERCSSHFCSITKMISGIR